MDAEVGVLVDDAGSSAPCPPRSPPWSLTTVLPVVDGTDETLPGCDVVELPESSSSTDVVTIIVVDVGSVAVVGDEVVGDEVVGIDEVELEPPSSATTVVSAPGTKAGGGVVLTEFAAANATPPNVVIAPTPAAMLINRFFIVGLHRGIFRTCPVSNGFAAATSG